MFVNFCRLIRQVVSALGATVVGSTGSATCRWRIFACMQKSRGCVGSGVREGHEKADVVLHF